MTRELKIRDVTINDESDCFVIAEIGHNHQGNVDTCIELFQKAKEAGANAVKLQKRDNKSLFTKQMYDSAYTSRHAYGDTYGAHREALEFPRSEYQSLITTANDLGICFMSTAFDFKSADLLADLDLPVFKMASGDLTNTPLLKHVAAFEKPIIISTGGSTMEDVQRAHDAIMPINPQLCIMQCTAGYPPAWEEMNLRVVETFREAFPDNVIGLSSHDSGIAMAVAAYVLGCRVVEKHFTLNRAMKGSDHAFSLEPQGLGKLVRDLHRTRIALGDGEKQAFESEVNPLFKMGKKLVAARDLKKGEVLSTAEVAIKSPNDGLPPYEIDRLIGKAVTRDMLEDEGFSMTDVDERP